MIGKSRAKWHHSLGRETYISYPESQHDFILS